MEFSLKSLEIQKVKPEGFNTYDGERIRLLESFCEYVSINNIVPIVVKLNRLKGDG